MWVRLNKVTSRMDYINRQNGRFVFMGRVLFVSLPSFRGAELFVGNTGTNTDPHSIAEACLL